MSKHEKTTSSMPDVAGNGLVDRRALLGRGLMLAGAREHVILPALRSAPADTIIAAPGTSCRHQIKDGTGRIAQHPAEILHDALA